VPSIRWLSVLVAALALATSARAAHADARPASEPALRQAPLLTLQGSDRVQLTFRLDAPLARRFDGEVLGSARISARAASLYPVGAATSHCYAARVAPGPMRAGRRYTVRLFLSATDRTPLEVVVPLRHARRGDARGARLGC
jgi:hypothetical protein